MVRAVLGTVHVAALVETSECFSRCRLCYGALCGNILRADVECVLPLAGAEVITPEMGRLSEQNDLTPM